MKRAYFTILSLVCFTSCSTMFPEILKTAEDVIDDTAITQKVSRESLQRNTNVKCTIELDNGQTQSK
jgi:HSP90 family molecular chaperone